MDRMRAQRWSGRGSLGFYVVIGIYLAAFAVFAFAYFGRLFLLIEYRQWSAPGNLFDPLTIFAPQNMFDPSVNGIARSRGFAFFVAALVGNVCGTSSPCHDAFQILLLVASAFGLAMLLRVLFPGAPSMLIAGAMVFFMCTESVLDALVWQATLHDKLSLFFTVLALYLVARLDLTRFGRRAVITSNLAMLLVVAAAYNTKEGVLSLLPSMAGLLAVRFLVAERDVSWPAIRRAVRGTFILLAAPTLYALLHVAIVFTNRMFLSPGEAARVTGGTWYVNMYDFAIYMFSARPLAESIGKFPYVPANEIGTFLASAVVIAVALGVVVARFAPRSLRVYWLWATVSFALAIVIPARTTTPAPFYLLVPTFYLSVWLFVTAYALVRSFPSRIAVLGTQTAFALLLASHVAGFAESTPFYFHIAAMSDNFAAALARLGAQLQRTPDPAHVVFLWPSDETRSYMFLASGQTRRLAEFILPAATQPAAYSALDGVITDQAYPPGAEPHPAPAPRTITIVLGPALQMRELVPPSP